MKKRLLLSCILLIGFTLSLTAQTPDLTPWTNGNYGNEWIEYGKEYVRVAVTEDGVYRVSFETLRSRLGNGINQNNVQVWRRGQEIAVITTPTEVIFYGLKNDGASDGLMFRPNPEARLNPHVSFFSEEGSYFFTICEEYSPARIQTVAGNPQDGATFEAYHWQKLIRTYAGYETSGPTANTRHVPPFAFTTFMSLQTELIQSYYTRANSFTSPMLYSNTTPVIGPSGITQSIPSHLTEPIQLINWDRFNSNSPVFEFSAHGHHRGTRDIDVRIAPTTESLEDLSKRIYSDTLIGNSGKKGENLVINPVVHLSESGEGYIQFRKPIVPNSTDWYGIGYYQIEYPQTTELIDPAAGSVFEFRSVSSTVHIEISNISSNHKVLNITDPASITELTGGTLTSGTLRLSIQKSSPETPLKLLVYNTNTGINTVQETAIYPVNFEELDESTPYSQKRTDEGAWNPLAYDYFIITSDRLGLPIAPASAAIEYSRYRSSTDGGSHRVLTVSIRNLYDQFNYGEPSALAIRRFVNFMLQNGIRPGKHQLFLIGHSVTLPNRVRRELPDEIPTFGDAGSDALLVAGLNGTSIDLPAIPVGRLSTFTQAQVRDYLEKVKEYENQTANATANELEWRKRIAHVIGARYDYEPAQFSGFFNSGRDGYQAPAQMVKSLDPDRSIALLTNEHIPSGGNGVKPVVPVSDLAPLVNAGLGMIAYYGHGTQTTTSYNIGYVSDSDFEYSDNQKYSFLYFNGCGVGNVFTSHTGHPISSNWLITPNKGAIAIFGNSYLSYVGPTASYLPVLYKHLFLRSDAQRKTVGEVLLDVNNEFLAGRSNDPYAYSNVHQTNLYGDPAMRILVSTPASALPVELIDFSGRLMEQSVFLSWQTASETNNSHFVVERSYNGISFEPIGKIDAKTGANPGRINSYVFADHNPMGGVNYYRLRQYDIGSDNSTLSKIISVHNKTRESLVIYPNPIESSAQILLNIPTKIASWTIRDLNGKVLARGKEDQLSLHNLSGGSYYLEIITTNGDIYSRNLIKK